MSTRYFEDVTVGETDSFGSYEVSEAEIIDFAKRFDPQPFHTDPEAAADSFFGELVASGWHTAAMTMRMLVEGRYDDAGVGGAVGVDDLRWTAPVRPDDVLHVETEVVGTDSHPTGLGLVSEHVTTVINDGDQAMSMVGLVLYERRADAD
jgi:acyl dehydratase